MRSMIFALISIAFIIVFCVILNNASNKVGVPVLLAFMVLGMIIGNIPVLKINFVGLESAEKIATVSLIFIMFYGGFGTRWDSARCIVKEAGLLASAGVVLTAGLTGLFCHMALGWGWVESFLMGSVVSSTDAASVFSILRSRKLGLKNHTAPLLEVESGSNDPCSYMLTLVFLSMMQGNFSAGNVIWMLFSQIAFGAGLGVLIAKGAIYVMKNFHFATSGFDSLFVVAEALLAYALPSAIGGNGYLSAYIVGIMMGNARFNGKKQLVAFFDGVTSLTQVLIFFMLGLLARPSMMHKVIFPALAIFAFMLLIARPASVAAVLSPFRKYGLKQQALISFVGLRGAASIVFAIMATVALGDMENDILNIVFVIVLVSIALQGFFIPYVAEKLDMVDKGNDVMKTFNDCVDESDMVFTEVVLAEDNNWVGKRIKDLGIPRNMLMCMVMREGSEDIVPNGHTVLQAGDRVIICSKSFKADKHLAVRRHTISTNKWIGKRIMDYPANGSQVIMIKRKDETVIPDGHTVLQKGDILYINQKN